MLSFAFSSLAVPKEEFALRAYTFDQYAAEFGKVYGADERAEREVIFNKTRRRSSRTTRTRAGRTRWR